MGIWFIIIGLIGVKGFVIKFGNCSGLGMIMIGLVLGYYSFCFVVVIVIVFWFGRI